MSNTFKERHIGQNIVKLPPKLSLVMKITHIKTIQILITSHPKYSNKNERMNQYEELMKKKEQNEAMHICRRTEQHFEMDRKRVGGNNVDFFERRRKSPQTVL